MNTGIVASRYAKALLRFAEENQEVIQAFLESHPDFEQVALDHPCKDIVVNGCLAITPEQYLTDGFFIAQLRKKA